LVGYVFIVVDMWVPHSWLSNVVVLFLPMGIDNK